MKPSPCVVERWQLDSKTEKSVRCLLVKAIYKYVIIIMFFPFQAKDVSDHYPVEFYLN